MAYRAVCDCGWRGRRRDKRSDADYDVRAHEWAHRQLDNVPPLTRETLDKIRVLLRGFPR